MKEQSHRVLEQMATEFRQHAEGSVAKVVLITGRMGKKVPD